MNFAVVALAGSSASIIAAVGHGLVGARRRASAPNLAQLAWYGAQHGRAEIRSDNEGFSIAAAYKTKDISPVDFSFRPDAISSSIRSLVHFRLRLASAEMSSWPDISNSRRTIELALALAFEQTGRMKDAEGAYEHVSCSGMRDQLTDIGLDALAQIRFSKLDEQDIAARITIHNRDAIEDSVSIDEVLAVTGMTPRFLAYWRQAGLGSLMKEPLGASADLAVALLVIKSRLEANDLEHAAEFCRYVHQRAGGISLSRGFIVLGPSVGWLDSQADLAAAISSHGDAHVISMSALRRTVDERLASLRSIGPLDAKPQPHRDPSDPLNEAADRIRFAMPRRLVDLTRPSLMTSE
jgi:hypothetical protein